MFKLLFIFLCVIFCLSGCSNNTLQNNNIESTNNTSNTANITNNINNLDTSENTTQENKKAVEEEISSYSSNILSSNANRQRNVELACSTLSGTIVKPGEEFSFCNTLGQATAEAGYKKAEIFDSDGDSILGYGGGKCQISSTLYNAVLALDKLEVTEREPHSKKVYYVPEGKDAAVAYGSVDFKFINHYDFDIKIGADANTQSITVKIFKITT